MVRELIHDIVLTPRNDEPESAELYGDLAGILTFGDGDKQSAKANRPPLVSDGRF